MITRSELLESKLPAPDMSTSPSGLTQAEQARQSHPETVQAFNVAPAVLAYIDGLPATPELFKPFDYPAVSVSQLVICVRIFRNSTGYALAHCITFSICPAMVMRCSA